VDMKNNRCWHKTDKAGVNEDGNLPYWENATDRICYAPSFSTFIFHDFSMTKNGNP